MQNPSSCAKIIVNALIANFHISHLVGFACDGDLVTKVNRWAHLAGH